MSSEWKSVHRALLKAESNLNESSFALSVSHSPTAMDSAFERMCETDA